jgi:hypothetical protein
MQVQAPKGQYRVIGQGRIDTLSSSEGPLWKDCETFDEAKDIADRSGESYFWTYVHDDSGELLYEAGSYREHAERLKQERPARSKT